MKHSKRNLLIALGLAASFVVPGWAMADNGHSYSVKRGIQQVHESRHEYRGDRHFDRRDRDDRHEWREHHRHDRYDRNANYRWHQWREHERQYRYLRHHRYYDTYPSAFFRGSIVLPTPRLFIDLH